MTILNANTEKVPWSGEAVSVQPRIRLSRSYDERYHTYLGYVLRIAGTCADKEDEFLVAVGKKVHDRIGFSAGMKLSGVSMPVPDPRLEVAGYYKTSGLKVLEAVKGRKSSGPPYHGAPPNLETYRNRGHRRLDPKTYEAKCLTCIWGCRMPVEIILDQWNQSRKKYRFETFCYGPKNCPLYRAGTTRKVPGRHGMSWEEEDWVDAQATEHRNEGE